MAHIELDKAQWREIHNAMCELFSAGSNIEALLEQFKGDPAQRLRDAINRVNRALIPGRNQDNAHDEKFARIANEAQAANNFDAVWSADEVSDFNALHPYTGATAIRYKDNIGKPEHTPIEGDRWIDLYRAADRAIKNSRDDHHIFIEAFKPYPDCPEVLKLSTGS